MASWITSTEKKNPPINLSQCLYVQQKSVERALFGIEFGSANGVAMTWLHTNKQQCDEDYIRILNQMFLG